MRVEINTRRLRLVKKLDIWVTHELKKMYQYHFYTRKGHRTGKIYVCVYIYFIFYGYKYYTYRPPLIIAKLTVGTVEYRRLTQTS